MKFLGKEEHRLHIMFYPMFCYGLFLPHLTIPPQC